MKTGIRVSLIVAVVAGISLVGLRSHALPANEVDTTYFKDATFTTEVGSTILFCNGARFREGTTSRFQLRTLTPCRGEGLQEVECIVDGVPTQCPTNLCDSELFSCS
jgi:hypothetical protein